MDKKTLESKSISDLKEIASSLGLSDTESLKKAELIGKILGGGSEEKSKDLFSKENDSSSEKVTKPEQVRKRTRKRIVVDPSDSSEESSDTTEKVIEAKKEEKEVADVKDVKDVMESTQDTPKEPKKQNSDDQKNNTHPKNNKQKDQKPSFRSKQIE